METRLTPEGVLLAVGDAYNLTETSGANKSRPVIRGQRVAYVARPLLAEVASTAHVLDLGGQPDTAGWTRLERAQSRAHQPPADRPDRGVLKRTFAVEPEEVPKKAADATAPEAPKLLPVRDVTVELDGDTFVIRTGARVASIVSINPARRCQCGSSPRRPSWRGPEAWSPGPSTACAT